MWKETPEVRRAEWNCRRKGSGLASEEAALLHVSLVPEVAEAVGNAGARGAGHRSPFAEGENEAAFFRGSGHRPPGSSPGKERDSNFGEGLGSQVMVPT